MTFSTEPLRPLSLSLFLYLDGVVNLLDVGTFIQFVGG